LKYGIFLGFRKNVFPYVILETSLFFFFSVYFKVSQMGQKQAKYAWGAFFEDRGFRFSFGAWMRRR
jgi:hypothetical protein